MSELDPPCFCLPVFTHFAGLLGDDEATRHDPVRKVLPDSGQLMLIDDDLDGIRVHQIGDFQSFGLAEHLLFNVVQLAFIELFAALLGEIGQ